MAAPTTAGKGCEPLYEDSGGGRITDSPPPRGQPVQTPDYSALTDCITGKTVSGRREPDSELCS